MNAQRRKQIKELMDEIENAYVRLELIKECEQDGFDNMPESLQMSGRGERMEECIDGMDSAMCLLEESIDVLLEVIQ